MNYAAHYNAIMERARDRVLEGYGELHHIVPKCLGGTDDEDNLVYLTAKEHYVAHQLLCKMHPTSAGLALAAMIMTRSNAKQEREHVLYGWIYNKVCVLVESRTILTPHGVFYSVRSASIELGIPRTTINSRLKSEKNEDWK